MSVRDGKPEGPKRIGSAHGTTREPRAPRARAHGVGEPPRVRVPLSRLIPVRGRPPDRRARLLRRRHDPGAAYGRVLTGSFYTRDLARIHDAGYVDFARAAAGVLLELAAPPGVVVELGCGGGISSAIVARAGFDVVGIDASDDMLEIARERVPGATFVPAPA